jgi:predicted O-linked N-acetylglucosamine transferase (SPINDLY family)
MHAQEYFLIGLAPIQVNYLGYPGSMGVDFMDYIIADKVIIDRSNQEFFSEKIVYLPNCYQVNDNKRIISHEVMTRRQFGLPDDKFVYCSFNNNYKITPEIFDTWMKILHQVQNSLLWVLVDNSIAKDNLVKEALKRGIASDRLYFAKKIELTSHLARHRLRLFFLILSM